MVSKPAAYGTWPVWHAEAGCWIGATTALHRRPYAVTDPSSATAPLVVDRRVEPYLPVGAVLGMEHARALVGRYRPRVLEAGRLLAGRLATLRPGSRIEGRVLEADDIVGFARDPLNRAIVLGVAWFEDDRGRLCTAAVALDWETSRVVTVE